MTKRLMLSLVKIHGFPRSTSIFIVSIGLIISNSAHAFTFGAADVLRASIGLNLTTESGAAVKASTFIQLQVPPPVPTASGSWRLVRTPGPEKGADIVSIMRTGDILKSDPDFAGLAIRCREKGGLQAALVVVTPFPPRAIPQVVLNDGRANVSLRASVLPGGSMLSLPVEAEALVKGPWLTAKELAIEIDGDGTKLRGIVPLAGLAGALDLLRNSCGAP